MKPAERVAGALCLLARHRGRPTATHPVRCRFCAVDLAQLEADVNADDNGALDAFMSMSERHRHELVAAAAEIPIASWADEL